VALPLSPQVFTILAALIESRAGLHYGPNDRELFAEKVSARAVELGFESLLDYYYFMRYDPGGTEELGLLVDTLLVHETYFFREREQLEWLVDGFLAPRVADGQRPRVWSAACATGEEPLTLAMLLDERGLGGKVEIVATDLSERALGRACEGVYPPRSLRHQQPPALAERYLSERGGRLVVAPEVHGTVEWRRVNLVVPAEVTALGQFDAVLCRNVLIYFSDQRTQEIIDALVDRIVGDGVLLVGVSESLLRFGSSVECQEHRGVFVYRPVQR
jgi:chemotaxis protein methyltransferase CheR